MARWVCMAFCLASGSRLEWQEVAANAPANRDEHSVVMEGQRMWIFGGRDANWARLNDLQVFDLDTKLWHGILTNTTIPKRSEHTAALDGHRMWIFGGHYYQGQDCIRLNDLHYFDIDAKLWQEVSASHAPGLRDGHSAVMNTHRMWVFRGCKSSPRGGGCNSWLNDLHYFDVRAMVWKTVKGQAPAPRAQHTAVVARKQMWIFGGSGAQGRLNDLQVFDLVTHTWREVREAGEAPSRRDRHSAVLDAQRMWIFGGRDVNKGPSNSLVNDLHYFDLEVERWQEVNTTSIPSRRWRHSAVMDAHHRMWLFGGETVMGDGWIKLADLYSLNLTGAPPPEIPTPQTSLLELSPELVEVDTDPEGLTTSHRLLIGVPTVTICLCLLISLRLFYTYRVRRKAALGAPVAGTLGVAAGYLVNTFPALAQKAVGKENPNFYEVCPHFACGERGVGYNKTCPRDGKPHCSVVDALEEGSFGQVTHFVSWC